MKWLSDQTGKDYRLPSEAEWEYAARTGTTTAWWWGDSLRRNRANCDGCGSQWDNTQTAPVGSFLPNPFSLSDTAGNVYEWVQDCGQASYENAPGDGRAWEQESYGNCDSRVLRGGSWDSGGRGVRSASRITWYEPSLRYGDIGFRLARGPKEKQEKQQ